MPELDNFLSAIESSTPAAEPAPTPDTGPETSTAPVETTTGKTVAEGEITGEPPAPQQDAKTEQPRDERGRWKKSEEDWEREVSGTRSAMLAEREKRQRLEQELRQREEAKAKEPKKDIWEDPDAYVEEKIRSKEGELLTKAEGIARELFFKHTERLARGRHDDYDAVREVFAEEAQKNPILVTQLRESDDPAEFIYQHGRTALELREVGGDLAAYRKRVEQQVRAKLEKEYADKAHRTDSVPKSLNTEPSKGAGIQGQTWDGPTPLEDMVKFNF